MMDRFGFDQSKHIFIVYSDYDVMQLFVFYMSHTYNVIEILWIFDFVRWKILNVIDYKELRKNVSFKNKYYKFFSYLAAHKHVDCLVLLLRIRIIIERIAIKA